MKGFSSYCRFPSASEFQEVFTAQLNEPLVAGDCGSWVYNTQTNKLFGHVVAASVENTVITIIPARDVFMDISAQLAPKQTHEIRQHRDMQMIPGNPTLQSGPGPGPFYHIPFQPNADLLQEIPRTDTSLELRDWESQASLHGSINPRDMFAFFAKAGAYVDEERLRNWTNQTSLFDGPSSSVDPDLTSYHMGLDRSPSPSASSWSGSDTSTRSLSTTFSRKSNRSHRSAATPPLRSIAAEATSVSMGSNIIHDLPRPVLMCEFAPLGLCAETFGCDDTQIWLGHIAGYHLHWNLPSHSICWFCDQEFSSKDTGSLREAFVRRLEHIKAHIIEDGYTAKDMRRDYFLLEHVYCHGLLPEIIYRRARECDEGPSTPGIVDYNYKPPERRSYKELDLRVIHDVGKEERHRRRRERHRRSEPRRAVKGVLPKAPVRSGTFVLSPPQTANALSRLGQDIGDI